MPRLTSLVRLLVPWVPSNAYVLAASLGILVAASLSHGLESGVRGAIAAFLAWAIARELAPERTVASLLAPWAGLAFAIPGDVDLLACLVVLLAARIAARSVGTPPTLPDHAALLVLAGWAASRPDTLPAALVLAAITFVDGSVLARLGGVAQLAMVLLVGSVEGTLTARPEQLAGDAVHAIALLAVVAGLVVALQRPPRRLAARADRGGRHLSGPRVRSARVATLAAVLATMAWTGDVGAGVVAAASGALVACALGAPRWREAP